MRKPCKRRRWTPDAGSINRAIYTSVQTGVTAPMQRDVLMPAFVAIDELRLGALTGTQFITLNEANCMVWQMGRQIAKHRANTESGELALAIKEKTETAAESLAAIGERKVSRGNFVATAAELDAIRLSLDLCAQLLALLPSGIALRAMIDAEKMVTESFNSRKAS